MHYQQNKMEAVMSVKVLISAMVTWPWVVFRTVILLHILHVFHPLPAHHMVLGLFLEK